MIHHLAALTLNLLTNLLQLFVNQFDEIPYAAIAYLTGECNYGGRVTDTWDRRLNVTILDDYVNPNIVEDVSYKFIQGLTFGAPKFTEHRLVIRFIEETIPVVPTPEVYGLHPNAGIQMDLNTSNLLLNSLLSVHSSAGSSGDANAEENLLAMVNDIDKRWVALDQYCTVILLVFLFVSFEKRMYSKARK